MATPLHLPARKPGSEAPGSSGRGLATLAALAALVLAGRAARD